MQSLAKALSEYPYNFQMAQLMCWNLQIHCNSHLRHATRSILRMPEYSVYFGNVVQALPYREICSYRDVPNRCRRSPGLPQSSRKALIRMDILDPTAMLIRYFLCIGDMAQRYDYARSKGSSRSSIVLQTTSLKYLFNEGLLLGLRGGSLRCQSCSKLLHKSVGPVGAFMLRVETWEARGSLGL